MVKSPCKSICKLNTDKVCIGCGRTVEEIKNWTKMTDQEKYQTVEISKKRLAKE